MIRFGFDSLDSLTDKDLCVSFGQGVSWHTLVDLVLLLWILEDYGLADGAITESIKTHLCSAACTLPSAKTVPRGVIISCIFSVAQ